MFPCVKSSQRVLSLVGCMILFMISAPAAQADNVWQSSFGQRWFYEVGNAGDVLAGTWWESSLTPGRTYTISFDVQEVRGRMVLLVGDDSAVNIDQPGRYSYDFNVTEDGKRRLLFQARSNDTLGSVNRIDVSERWVWSSDSTSTSSSGNWIPRGHYVSFARERNLKTEMMELIDRPWTAPSDYAMNRAEALHAALTTPGVKGFWMEFDWRTVEVGDGQYDWSLLDDNLDVARRYGLKLLIKIADRSFDGSNILPRYFPSQYVLWTSGGGSSGFVAKRWDPYVYDRLIRLYRRIANRYASHAGFGGIATSETALGSAGKHWDYTLAKYRNALSQVVTQTQGAMPSGRLFLYLNFLKGGDSSDMNKDARVALLRNVPRGSLVVGAPDITPDVRGMPGSASSYRIHARNTMPDLQQFCHLQHVDQGLGGINVKNNRYRREYFDQVATVRQRERQSWFSGTPAVFEFDDLRDPQGNRVDYHPDWVLGDLWRPDELFRFGKRNFDCDYFIWHYRENVDWNQFGWQDVRQVILNNQYFYEW